MDGNPHTYPTQEWDDIEDELTSTVREACSFSFELPHDENRHPATAFEVVRDRPRRVMKPVRTR
jgi:hypothetical protein